MALLEESGQWLENVDQTHLDGLTTNKKTHKCRVE